MNQPLLDTFRERLRAGADATLRSEIQSAVVAHRVERGAHREWGLLCEEAGLMALAFSEFQLALRNDLDDPLAAFHLAQHYRERGDTGRALALLERLLVGQPRARIGCRCSWKSSATTAPSPVQGRPSTAPSHRGCRLPPRSGSAAWPGVPPLRIPPSRPRANRNSSRATRIASASTDCFPAAKAPTRANGSGRTARAATRRYTSRSLPPSCATTSWARSRSESTPSGWTARRRSSRWTWTSTSTPCSVRGDPQYAQQLRDILRVEGPRLLGVLRGLGFAPLFENSGYKGRHFWVFLEEPETAGVLHLFGKLLLAWQTPHIPAGLHLEYFPKQANLKGKGLGNLIKLPLGIHRCTGRRSELLDDQSQPLREPLIVLRSVVPSVRTALYAAIEQLKGHSAASAAPAAIDSSAQPAEAEPAETAVPLPAPPPPAPVWTEADFETDPRVRHLLAECAVLAELKRTVDEHRRLSHEEQLVLIHSMGHLEGGPQAVNYLFAKCVDVGPEKLMKDRLKGNPVSCPSIRKKIPHITRRAGCNCHFDFASDRYPTPVLHLLTLPAAEPKSPPPPSAAPLAALAQRFGVLDRQRRELEQEWRELRGSLIAALVAAPERAVACAAGHYRLVEREGVEELLWEAAETGPGLLPRRETCSDGPGALAAPVKQSC